jgi:hypothetical protein
MRTPIICLVVLSGFLSACAHFRSKEGSADAQSPAPTAVTTVVPNSQPAPDAAQRPVVTPAKPKAEIPSEDSVVAKSAPASPARVAAAPKSNPPKATSSVSPKPAAAPTAPVPAAPAVKPQLDFKAMEQRLRDTSAIGVFTKLSIKNQADDLLNAFRGYYAGHVPPTLDDLHSRFDGLLLKVVSLVQNDDSTLASSISASRGAIWEKLSNKESFLSL